MSSIFFGLYLNIHLTFALIYYITLNSEDLFIYDRAIILLLNALYVYFYKRPTDYLD